MIIPLQIDPYYRPWLRYSCLLQEFDTSFTGLNAEQESVFYTIRESYKKQREGYSLFAKMV